jgi:uncharacterized membrane protein YfcA
MEFVTGFLIALAIGLTGVGGGTITAPVLMLFFNLPPAQAVGTALTFTAAVKLLAAPLHLYRGHVNFRVLGYLLLGGLPGVLAGSLLLDRMTSTGRNGLLSAVLGATIVITALISLYRMTRPASPRPEKDRSGWLSALALPIGAEVGFSSAGAGALGTLALFSLTSLTAAQVVGTDLTFGLALSLVGGGIQFSAGNYDGVMLVKLIAGGLAGALVGTHLAGVLPSRVLRAALCLWLVTLGGQLCWTGLRHW